MLFWWPLSDSKQRTVERDFSARVARLYGATRLYGDAATAGNQTTH